MTQIRGVIRAVVILELVGAVLAGIIAWALAPRPDPLALGVTFVTMLHALVLVVTITAVFALTLGRPLAACWRRLLDHGR